MYPHRKRGFTLSAFDELVDVMEKLRSKNGCPWDREQSHESLKPYIIEETYEVLDAIDAGDDVELREELGDLLLQIVFHAQIASEQDRFTMNDVAASIVEKLKRRHPHVFGDVEVEDSRDVLRNWEEIKKQEGKDSVLEGVPDGLPALLKAQRIQEKVGRVGFDWEDIGGAFAKVHEEIDELDRAVKEGDREGMEDEFGDILFSLVNVARFLDINAEESLRQATKKVSSRFRYIERRIAEKGDRSIEEYSLEELDDLWDEAKPEKRGGP
jgi:tetrapyrrole methylase family protein/MazG family protein